MNQDTSLPIANSPIYLTGDMRISIASWEASPSRPSSPITLTTIPIQQTQATMTRSNPNPLALPSPTTQSPQPLLPTLSTVDISHDTGESQPTPVPSDTNVQSIMQQDFTTLSPPLSSSHKPPSQPRSSPTERRPSTVPSWSALNDPQCTSAAPISTHLPSRPSTSSNSTSITPKETQTSPTKPSHQAIPVSPSKPASPVVAPSKDCTLDRLKLPPVPVLSKQTLLATATTTGRATAPPPALDMRASAAL